jgi:hypothetical protein
MNYDEITYVQLKRLCKQRGLGGSGTRKELLAKLEIYDTENPPADDQDTKTEFIAVDRAGRPLVKHIPKNAKLSDPDPTNLNYDLGGKWRRRPPNFEAWAEDGTPIVKERKPVSQKGRDKYL